MLTNSKSSFVRFAPDGSKISATSLAHFWESAMGRKSADRTIRSLRRCLRSRLSFFLVYAADSDRKSRPTGHTMRGNIPYTGTNCPFSHREKTADCRRQQRCSRTACVCCKLPSAVSITVTENDQFVARFGITFIGKTDLVLSVIPP